MSQTPLFQADTVKPLADRMRPITLDECVGHEHLLAADKPLRQAIEQDRLHSMVFWGPPGTGKTTLARLLAHYCGARFISISAVLSGVKEIREAIALAKEEQSLHARRTILFVDEVHRFNKSQQDAFLPHIEDGTIYFVGATTENPSFELNNALLSRARTYVLKTIGVDDIVKLLKRALRDKDRGLGADNIIVEDELLELIASTADGDARRALNMLEIAADLSEVKNEQRKITQEVLQNITSHSLRRFDKGGDLFYDQISALHKAVRGSDPDAALFWMCAMLDGGCDPIYIARRVVRMASEDIGNADPRGLRLALDAWETYERLGSPEGELALGQAVIYLACAAKSNAVYTAFKAAMRDVREHGTPDVPMHLRNAPTKLMKELDYGKNYRYAHDEENAFASGETYFPEGMVEKRYYQPVERGLEIKIAEKLASLRKANKNTRSR